MKTVAFPVVLSVVLMVSCKSSRSAFVKNGIDIYVERVSENDSDANRFTRDNTIYTPGREFIFDYHIEKDGKKLKMASPESVAPGEDFDRMWTFCADEDRSQNVVRYISFQVDSGFTNETQTKVQYNYYCRDGNRACDFSSISGVIENEKNVWTHPHRMLYFMILELNPFPYIQKPYRINHSWEWKLRIGDYWGDPRWMKWKGSIENNYQYRIVRKENLNTAIGTLPCLVVEGEATSRIGQTSLVAYFNKQHGFVKFDYTNIDQTKLIMDIRKIVQH